AALRDVFPSCGAAPCRIGRRGRRPECVGFFVAGVSLKVTARAAGNKPLPMVRGPFRRDTRACQERPDSDTLLAAGREEGPRRRAAMAISTKPLPGTTHDPLYPDSDGEPMGETDFHIAALILLRQALQYYFARRRVYVATDMFL